MTPKQMLANQLTFFQYHNSLSQLNQRFSGVFKKYRYENWPEMG